MHKNSEKPRGHIPRNHPKQRGIFYCGGGFPRPAPFLRPLSITVCLRYLTSIIVYIYYCGFSVNMSISFLFFLHGESTVCASIDVRQHPPLYNLQTSHLTAALQLATGVPGTIINCSIFTFCNKTSRAHSQLKAIKYN